METSQVQNVLPKGYILQAPNNTYRIEKVLGMGGFGITYLATTTVQFGNLKTTISVAIKEHFISDSCERDAQTHNIVYSNPVKGRVESSQRDFVAEARRLQKVGVEHTNIVKVNEVFETNNTAYYVMEYLNGESLRTYVERKGKLPEDEMLTLMRPIMSAVKLLHEHHMTHLDIKPDNIMLTSDEYGDIRPVLIDFGLSKHYGKDGRPTSTINTLGYTDGYAPVEQYAGLTTFSPSADIYALGATMLFCLTGKDPKKSIDFKEADKETLLNSLSLTDDTRCMLRNALLMDASKRQLSTVKNTVTEASTDHNQTNIIDEKRQGSKTDSNFQDLFQTLIGHRGTTWQRVIGVGTLLAILLFLALYNICMGIYITSKTLCWILQATVCMLLPLGYILRVKWLCSATYWITFSFIAFLIQYVIYVISKSENFTYFAYWVHLLIDIGGNNIYINPHKSICVAMVLGTISITMRKYKYINVFLYLMGIAWFWYELLIFLS